MVSNYKDSARNGTSESPEGATASQLVLTASEQLLWAAMPDLNLNIAQTAILCGISVRQLGYWTKQGYIAASGRGARRTYGELSLRRILAIRSSMNSGFSLRQSVRGLDSRAEVSKGEGQIVVHYPVPSSVVKREESKDEISAAELKAITHDLKDLAENSRRVRDSASGLATKLGRREAAVRAAAEELTRIGCYTKQVTGDAVIYSWPMD